MKTLIITILLFALVAINCKSGAKITKISATSTFEKNNDFLNCENIKKSMVESNGCVTKGAEKKDEICEEYKQQLEKELDCKMSCKLFYKKYFDITIETKEKQADYYKEQNEKKFKKDVEFEVKELKKSKDSLIEVNCVGDIFSIGSKEKK